MCVDRCIDIRTLPVEDSVNSTAGDECLVGVSVEFVGLANFSE